MTIKTKNESSNSMNSHLEQFHRPLYSTVEFEKFLNKHRCFIKETRVLDIGCGCGAVTQYMAAKHPNVNFIGGDYNDFLIEKGKAVPENNQTRNLDLVTADLFNLPESIKGRISGIFNVHTLCCMKRLEPTVDGLVRLNPDWIAFNSLFYDGPLDVLIHIRDHSDPGIPDDNPDADFNVFSLSHLAAYLRQKGYEEFVYERFEISEALKKPAGGKRGTYTMKTEMSERTQFSGPVHLPWHFVLARRKNNH